MLDIKSITKKYNQKIILNNVSLHVKRGEIAVLLGESGVGKSTLLRILNNLETIDSGTISLDGKKLNLDHVAAQHVVGMVFQQFNLFEHITVEQNITLALEKVLKKSKKEAKTIAHALLKHYGLEDKANNYPSQLSGGQKQRLAIARTIALKPKVICLDEPTSALDPLLTTHVANTIQELAKEGYIVLVASHDTGLLEKLDCSIYLMKQGSIIETAKSIEFRGFPEHYPLIHNFVRGHISEQ